MKNNKEDDGTIWYYAVARSEGYGVFTEWERAREECEGYSCNRNKKFKTFEEAKEYAEEAYEKMQCDKYDIGEIKLVNFFYRRIMKREYAQMLGIKIKPFTIWPH